MPRTSKKTTATAETPDSVIVPLHPDQEEQPPADEPAQAPEPDEQSDSEEQPDASPGVGAARPSTGWS